MSIQSHKVDQKQRTSSRRVVYPDSDGKPMGETDRHVQCIIDALQALKWYFADRSDVYIAGNNFIYFEEGNPAARVSPDTYIVFGVAPDFQDSFKTWLNGDRTPSFVIEFTSRETRREDYGRKYELYEKRFGVSEYFIFDPRAEYQSPRLRGFRLLDGIYEPIVAEAAGLRSEQIGLTLIEQNDRLRFFDPSRNGWLPTTLEETQRADAESARAQEEAKARIEAEAEVERLRAEIEALKRERSR